MPPKKVKSTGALKKAVNAFMNRTAFRKRTGKSAKDRAATNANTKNTIMNIMAMNRSPVPKKRNVTFHWSSYFKLNSLAAALSNTVFFSLSSPQDPDLSNSGTTKGCPYFWELMGTGNMQYERFRVKYLDICVKCINTLENTYPLVCISVSNKGGADFVGTPYIHNIATRLGCYSKMLEYSGDTTWTTYKFRVYPWQVMGVKKRMFMDDIAYQYQYNGTGNVPPYLCISVGDSMQQEGTNLQIAQNICGQLYIDYHCTISNPVAESYCPNNP